MSEEQLIKDGALFFNAPDKTKRKPNVIYYSTTAETTGIDYVKPSEVEKLPGGSFANTTWFKIVMTISGMALTMGVISIIYFLVVKLRKKEPVEPKDPSPLETPPVVYEGVTEQSHEVAPKPIVLEDSTSKDVRFFQKYFESLLPASVKP